ncbi:hypothetical protein [Streptomyces sp. NBC_00212]|uniref:hypothetical protein n=1 Tax=Streptomyces sp. NBC_00212 TaxID=2975684 RepID=UPI00324B8100
MRIRIAAVVAGAASMVLLAACGGGTPHAPTSSKAPAATASVDCTSQTVTQQDWIDHCAKGASKTDLTVGETFAWQDGVAASVTRLELLTAIGSEESRPTADQYGFRVLVTVKNGEQVPLDLGKITLLAEGATTGGAASMGIFRGADDLTGQLAPGVTVTKNAGFILDKKYGMKVVITVQRGSDQLGEFAFPKFTGTVR